MRTCMACEAKFKDENYGRSTLDPVLCPRCEQKEALCKFVVLMLVVSALCFWGFCC